VRVASGPDPPGSSRCVFERRKTSVPRVCLSATLATPASSGSTDTPWLCRGRLPPVPAPPETGCPQLHRPAATGRRRRSLTSTQSTSASRRTGGLTHLPRRAQRGRSMSSSGTMSGMNLCPACGLEQDEPPWRDGVGSQEICSSCGLQFGYQDACGGRVDLRPGFYVGWRVRWIWEEHPWHSRTPGPPAGWSPHEQLARLAWPPEA
jgi:hypothetical protein